MILTKAQVPQLLNNLNAAAQDKSFANAPDDTLVEVAEDTLVVSMQPPKLTYGDAVSAHPIYCKVLLPGAQGTGTVVDAELHAELQVMVAIDGGMGSQMYSQDVLTFLCEHQKPVAVGTGG